MVTRRSSGKRGFPLGWLIAGLVVGGAIYWGTGLLHNDAGKGGPQGGGVPASVAEVIAKGVTPFSEFSGKIEAVSAAEIRPQVGGQITQVLFKDGSEVKKGDALFVIDPRPYEAEVERSKGVLASAQSAQLNASQNLKRAKQLIKAKAISTAEYDQLVSAATQAEGAFASAKGALTNAQVNLDYAHITAPISGKISRAEITEGNVVQAGGGAPLLASIVTLSPIYASFDIDEQTFLHTIQGVPASELKSIPVEVGLSGDAGTAIKATIHDFDNQIAPGSGTIRVRAVIANKDGALVPGLFAKVRLGTPQPVNTVLINPVAIGTDQDKKFVLALDADNKAEYRVVTLGAVLDGMQMVTSGLKAGDRIVVSGLQRLRPGVPVMAQMVDMRTLKGADAPAAGAPDAAAKDDAAAKKDAAPATDAAKSESNDTNAHKAETAK